MFGKQSYVSSSCMIKTHLGTISFVGEKILSKEVDIRHVNTYWQVVDIVTKFLDIFKLK